MADVQEQMSAKDAKLDEVIARFSKELEDKSVEIAQMRDSKRVFSDRGQAKGDVSKWGQTSCTRLCLVL